MAPETELEVYRQLYESQNKYTYFLLAAVGAAIGFAITQTNGKSLNISQIPLAISLLLWAGSFYCGCKYLAYYTSALRANLGYFKIIKGQDPIVGDHPQMIKAAEEGISSAFESNSNYGAFFWRWQFRFCVFGGISYILWCVLEMYLRS